MTEDRGTGTAQSPVLLMLCVLVVGALALWGLFSLQPLLRPWVLPVELTVQVRPALRAASTAREPQSAPPWRRLKAEVRRQTPVEGFALGDTRHFDRYGVLAAQAGTVQCVWLPSESLPVQITPLGGARHHADAVQLTRDPDATGCPESTGQ